MLSSSGVDDAKIHEKFTEWTNVSDNRADKRGNVFDLEPHHVVAPPGFLLKGFVLECQEINPSGLPIMQIRMKFWVQRCTSKQQLEVTMLLFAPPFSCSPCASRNCCCCCCCCCCFYNDNQILSLFRSYPSYGP